MINCTAGLVVAGGSPGAGRWGARHVWDRLHHDGDHQRPDYNALPPRAATASQEPYYERQQRVIHQILISKSLNR